MSTFIATHTKTVPTAKWFHEQNTESQTYWDKYCKFMKLHFGDENFVVQTADTVMTITITNTTQDDLDRVANYFAGSNVKWVRQSLDGFDIYNLNNAITSTTEFI